MDDHKKKDERQVRRTGKSNRLNLRVDNEVIDILNTISLEDDEAVSQVVRKAIKQYDLVRKNKHLF